MPREEKKFLAKDFHATKQPGGQVHVHLKGKPLPWATGATKQEAMKNFERDNPNATRPTR